MPTSSAVVGDVLEISRGQAAGRVPSPLLRLEEGLRVLPMEEVETCYYIRLTAADQPGVLAQVARIMGDLGISIDSVIQKDADRRAQTAEIVITTHPAREAAVQKALGEIARLSVVQQVSNLVRLEDWPEEGSGA